MARVYDNWERLVRATLNREQLRTAGQGHERIGSGIAGAVPPSLGRTSNIDAILQAADEIQDENPNVARILCEQAYSMAQNLDPNSDGRGVLQFKTGLMSIIKQKLAKRENVRIDRNQDIEQLWEFYKLYKRRHRVDDIQRQEQNLRESGTFSSELELRSLEMRKVIATLRALVEVLEALSKDADPEGVGRLITEELRRIKKADAALSGELTPYNIVPLEAPSLTNAIGFFPEVRGAISAIRYSEQFPRLPADFEISGQRDADMFDLLEYVFGFQKDNIRNQRENIVLAIANAQARLGIPADADPMAKELDAILDHGEANPAPSCITEDGSVSFLDKIIRPIYETMALEAARNNNGKASHSSWRNYDDFNEYFWSPACFELKWPMREESPFLFKPKKRKRTGKSTFVEHRTFLHLYRSFHRLWIFLFVMFQALTILAFRKEKINLKTFKTILSIGPTFAIMNFIESCLDVLLMFGAYSTARGMAISRLVIRFFWCGLASVFVTYVYIKVLEEQNQRNSNSKYFRIYILTLGIYAAVRVVFALLLKCKACHMLSEMSDQSFFQFFKWIYQERYYVGRGLFERFSDYCRFVLCLLELVCAVLVGDLNLQVHICIKPLVEPTKVIIDLPSLQYSWHDLVSKNNKNALTIVSLWAPVVAIYLMDLHIWYTLLSAIIGGVMGARARLGEIRTIEMVHKRFESFPKVFVKNLVSLQAKRLPFDRQASQVSQELNKEYASIFSPFWNEIIKSLREEDFISNREMDLLSIPSNTGSLRLVQWPLFLLSSKIFLAIDLALDCKDTQADLWNRICRDEYMSYAVQECYYSIEKILHSLVDGEGRLWVERIFREINNSILENSLVITLSLKKLPLVLSRFTALTGLLIYASIIMGELCQIRNETPDLAKGAAKALFQLYEVVTHDLLSSDLREQLDTWNILARARNEGRLFSRIEWPKDPEIKEQVKRLHLLLTVKDSAANIPKNLEARRRLEFFSNSLFMDMPPAKPVCEMIPFSVFTPYYSETVLYSTSELQKENEDGISILFYLQKIFPDEWENFLERIGRGESAGGVDLQENSTDSLELRFWASYRGQTLARTVRGMMYYRRALMLQSYLERRPVGVTDYSRSGLLPTQGFALSHEARAQSDLKFTYVVSCQIYGQQKQRKAPEAADIALLLQRNEALRVAFIHVEDSSAADGKVSKEFFSKLVKADIHGKDQEIYSIRLPGDPKLGEGKPENQNHAIIFTRGEAIQTIDMNQRQVLPFIDVCFPDASDCLSVEYAELCSDVSLLRICDNYLEEAMKMRNLLEEFRTDHGIRPPSILGCFIFGLVHVQSRNELCDIGPTRVGKSFEVSGLLPVYLLCRKSIQTRVRMHYGHPDVFDRIFHITRGGISKASRVINISEDIYAGFNSTLRQGNVTHHEYIQVGKGRDVGLNQIALFEGKVAGGNGEQVLSRDVYRLGQLFDFFRMLSFYFTTVGYYLCTMMTVLTIYIFLYGRAYLAFSGLDRAISRQAKLSGNTSLNAVLNTQFLVQIGVFTAVPMIMGFILELGLLKELKLITLDVPSSMEVQSLEVALLLIVYIAYGYAEGGAVSYVLLTLSSWFLVISWLFAPYIFNPSGFEWQKTVEDFDDWSSWLLYKGGVDAYPNSERSYFGNNTEFEIYGFSWVVLVGIVMIFKIFTFNPKSSSDFQLLMRLTQGASSIGLVAALILVIIFTRLSIADIFASILAFIPTGWAIICLALTWKNIVRSLGLWESVREFARMYDAGMGVIIFAPVAFLSWFPFVSTFQSRLLFNQAFSRGLEISLILAGNKANVDN
ncbi:callose synthase 10 [Citrus sinensis]|uniref:Callose synthase 10 n=1 Tax=Citrus sinensis TaxID=2711 RepID=A0ACB8LTB9_CITSI|nr:callose synthase 10 [Citrus sinensis]